MGPRKTYRRLYLSTSPDKGHILVLAVDGTIFVIDWKSAQVLYQLNSQGAVSAEFMWGERYICAIHQRSVVIWENSPKPCYYSVELKLQQPKLWISHDGDLFALANPNGSDMHSQLLLSEIKRQLHFRREAECKAQGYILQAYPCVGISYVTGICEECATGSCVWMGVRYVNPKGDEPRILHSPPSDVIFYGLRQQDKEGSFIKVIIPFYCQALTVRQASLSRYILALAREEQDHLSNNAITVRTSSCYIRRCSMYIHPNPGAFPLFQKDNCTRISAWAFWICVHCASELCTECYNLDRRQNCGGRPRNHLYNACSYFRSSVLCDLVSAAKLAMALPLTPVSRLSRDNVMVVNSLIQGLPIVVEDHTVRQDLQTFVQKMFITRYRGIPCTAISDDDTEVKTTVDAFFSEYLASSYGSQRNRLKLKVGLLFFHSV
jgi:hypothetical protein